MRKVQTKKIRLQREIEHNRGKIIEGVNGFHTLYIGAEPNPYDFSNWTITDLKDLADSINQFLKIIKRPK